MFVVVPLSSDVKFFTATVHLRLGPVFPTLCGDLSGEHWSVRLEMAWCHDSGLPDCKWLEGVSASCTGISA